ncbi:MAG: SDR family NAD(P)-dependent oxidoreductase [Actinomycetota bacterium]
MAVVLVTEAERGLGADLALGLAGEGHLVVAGSPTNDPPPGIEPGTTLVPVKLDLSRPETIPGGVDEAAQVYGGLDAVVANGEVGRFTPFELMDARALERLLQVDLVGQLQVVHHAIGHLRRARNGRIVAISNSLGGLGLPGGVAACAARAGFEAAMNGLRIELQPFDIDISVIEAAPATLAEYGIPYEGQGVLDDAYQRLADGVKDFGCYVEKPASVVDMVQLALTDLRPRPRYARGPYAEFTRQLRQSEPEQASQIIRELFAL